MYNLFTFYCAAFILSNNSNSFFNHLPIALYGEIASFTPSKDLLKLYKLTRQSKFAIALCNRQDKDSIKYATDLFKTNGSVLASNKNNDNYILKQNILASMQSPNSNAYHKLGALMFLSEAANIPMSISDNLDKLLPSNLSAQAITYALFYKKLSSQQQKDLIKKITSGKKEKSVQDNFQKLEILRELSFCLNDTQLNLATKSVSSLLFDFFAYCPTNLLKNIARRLNSENVNSILILLINQLYFQDLRYQITLVSLPEILPYTTTEQINSGFDYVWKLILTNYKKQEGLVIIEKMIPYLNEEQINSIIETLFKNTKSKSERIMLNALNALIKIALRINDKDTINKVARIIIKNIYHNKENVRDKTIIYLKRIINKLSEENIVEILKITASKVNDRDLQKTRIKILAILAAKVSDEQTNEFIDTLIGKLRVSDKHVQIEAIKSLTTIAKIAKDKQFAKITNAMHRELTNNNDFLMADPIINYFYEVSSLLNEEKLNSIIPSMLRQLDEVYAYKKALIFFTSIFDRMGQEQKNNYIARVFSWGTHGNQHDFVDDYLKALEVIAPYINEEQIDKLMETVDYWLISDYKHNDAIKLLEIIAKHVNNKEKIIKKIIDIVTNPKVEFKNSFTDTLSRLMMHSDYARIALKNKFNKAEENNTPAYYAFCLILDAYTNIITEQPSNASEKLNIQAESSEESSEHKRRRLF